MAVTFTFAYLSCYALLHKQLLHVEAIMYIRASCCQFAMHCISAFIQHQNRTYDNCFV